VTGEVGGSRPCCTPSSPREAAPREAAGERGDASPFLAFKYVDIYKYKWFYMYFKYIFLYIFKKYIKIHI